MTIDESQDNDNALLASHRALFPHMSDMYFSVLMKRGLGLPDQYNQPNAMSWAKKVLKDLDITENHYEGHVLRLGCIRFRCAKCRLPCEDLREANHIAGHIPYIFPCGHIIGSSCYHAMVEEYEAEGASPLCP
ncbi:hypothetical protein FSHL1_011478 [Fusarium sambucinum]